MPKPAYQGRWKQLAAAKIAAHRAQFGDWCPGFGCVAHYSDDLVLDHTNGPGTPIELCRVLCRACNGRKAQLVDRPRARRARGLPAGAPTRPSQPGPVAPIVDDLGDYVKDSRGHWWHRMEDGGWMRASQPWGHSGTPSREW